MKKLLSASLLLATASLPLTSWAGADSGIYIGGAVGQSQYDADINDVNLDADDTAYKVLIGYNFGVLPLVDLAVEADYRDFGEFENKNALYKSDATSVDVFGIAGFNFGPVGVFGKVGYADMDADTEIGDLKFNSSDSNTAYGVGAKVHLGSLAVRLEYEEFDLDDAEDLSMWSLGATVTF